MLVVNPDFSRFAIANAGHWKYPRVKLPQAAAPALYGAEINSFGTSLTIGTPTVTKGCAIYSPQFAVQLTGSGLWESSNDSVYQTGGFSGIATIKANNTSSATISDCTAQSNGNPVFQTANTAFIHVRGCHINAASTFFWADSHTQPGGSIYDDGANVITGSTSSDAIPTAGHGIWGIGTGTATSSATLFLVGQNAVANAFTNTTATTISGIAQFTGTLSDLVCTFTTAGLATDSVTVQTAPLSTGTFAATTLTVTNLTTTTVSDHTHTASVTLGQPVQFKFVTNAADTLAGAQCRVSLH